jgi:acetyl esterase/lipase
MHNAWIALVIVLLVFGCSPMRLVNSLSDTEDLETLTNFSYGTDVRQQLDVYMPKKVVEDSPVVVFFYGGSWKRGEKEKYSFVGHTFSSMGYVTVIPNYRLYPQVKFPAFVEDGAEVLSWVSENLQQAKNGVVIMGHSAGAHTAALLAFDHSYLLKTGQSPDIIRGMVGLAGPYGFNPMKYRSTRPIFAGIEQTDLARPVAFACSAKAPVLLFHGVDDGIVIPANSRELKRSIDACGGSVDYFELEDTGHFTIVLGLSGSFLAKSAILSPLEMFLQTLSRQPITTRKT